MNSSILNPNIPFTNPLSSPLKPGNLIRINGTVSYSANCFSINLQSSPTAGQRSDIALHLSPVFSPPPRLVRNSLENHNWGPEESHGASFPFAIGQQFEILILIEADHFKIAVNGQHFTEFQYRLPLQNISHIAVDGDVTISAIKFEGAANLPEHSVPSEVTMPLGFMISDSKQNIVSPNSEGFSQGAHSSFHYPTSFGPSANPNLFPPSGNAYGQSTNPYGPPSPSHPYGPSSSNNPYGPQSPNNPYGPPSPSQPYGPQSAGYPPPPDSGSYGPPQRSASPYGIPSGGNAYPQQTGAYPSQPGPYPGTSVVYPGKEKTSSGGMNLGPLAAAGAAALAGVAGSAVLGGKHKKKKHGHGMTGMLGHGVGPTSLLGGVGSLLGGNKSHGHSGGSGIPIGGAMAGGAAALAGAYMLSKSPIGKVMKPKKMKKLYKHKGGWGSSSSSSSSD